MFTIRVIRSNKEDIGEGLEAMLKMGASIVEREGRAMVGEGEVR